MVVSGREAMVALLAALHHLAHGPQDRATQKVRGDPSLARDGVMRGWGRTARDLWMPAAESESKPHPNHLSNLPLVQAQVQAFGAPVARLASLYLAEWLPLLGDGDTQAPALATRCVQKRNGEERGWVGVRQ